MKEDRSALPKVSTSPSSELSKPPQASKEEWHAAHFALPRRSGNAEIWIMDADGSNLVQVTNHPSLDSFADW
jgi:hypothetical protein